MLDLDALPLRWFRRWLLGEDNGIDREPPVRIFVMGANVWRDEQEWPLARTSYAKYYLHSGGRANSLFGDGALSPEPPTGEKPDAFVYDPANPVPFITEPAFNQLGGPDDYRPVERRDDVLVYSTPPLTEPMEVCGPLKVKLFAASSAKDTDWTAKVLDVHPDGYAQRLNDGDHPRPLPQGARPPGPARARRGRRVRDRLLVDLRGARRGSPPAPRDRVKRVPEVRPQPEHRRADRHGHGGRQGQSDRLPRRVARVVSAAAGRPGGEAAGYLPAPKTGGARGKR